MVVRDAGECNEIGLLTVTWIWLNFRMSQPAPRPTQKAVATMAGCSIMTVSRALRGDPRVRKKLAENIRRIARELGYRPDPVLSALNSYRIRSQQGRDIDVIAYLTNWRTEFGWQKLIHLGELYRGAEQRATELGFKLEPFWLRSPGLKKKRASEILRARGIRGVIVSPLQANVGHINMDWEHFTTVSIGHSVLSPRLHFVTSDYFQGVVMAMRRLQQMGYSRIGLAIGRRHDVRTLFRWNSACLGLQAQESRKFHVKSFIENIDAPLRQGVVPQPLEIHSFQEWFRKEKPDAVMSLGPGIPDWIREFGLRVPEDVGYANLDLHDRSGEFAGVYQHPELIGAAAVDLLQILFQRFETGLPTVPQSLVVSPSWIDGATAAPKSGRTGRKSTS